MRSCHFGNLIAGSKVVSMLEDLGDSHLQAKVVSIFQDFSLGLKELGRIQSRGVFENLWECWKELYRSRVMGGDFPEKLKTHLVTTLVGAARDMRRINLVEKGWVGKRKARSLVAQIQKHQEAYHQSLPLATPRSKL